MPLACPKLGTWPTTVACALTGDPTSDPLTHTPATNPLGHMSQGYNWVFFSKELSVVISILPLSSYTSNHCTSASNNMALKLVLDGWSQVTSQFWYPTWHSSYVFLTVLYLLCVTFLGYSISLSFRDFPFPRTLLSVGICGGSAIDPLYLSMLWVTAFIHSFSIHIFIGSNVFSLDRQLG